MAAGCDAGEAAVWGAVAQAFEEPLAAPAGSRPQADPDCSAAEAGSRDSGARQEGCCRTYSLHCKVCRPPHLFGCGKTSMSMF